MNGRCWLLLSLAATSLGCTEDTAVEEPPVDVAPVDVAPATDPGPADPGKDTAAAATPPAPECGDVWFADNAGFKRYPYLQSITQTDGRIVWTTTTEAAGAVEIAASPDGPWTRFEANRELFDMARTLDIIDYFAFDAAVEGLKAGHTVCYRLLQDDKVIASGLHFTSAWTDPDRPLRILAFGDSGSGSDDQKGVRDAFMAHDFDIFLHMGDMAYGSGTFTEFEAHFFDIYKDLLHKAPTWPTMGNHEYKTNAGQPYLDVYYLPEQAQREEEQERYYSFDYGDVHMVSVETNDAPLIIAGLYELSGEPSMLSWLRADLAASDKPWKIAFFHHPPYSSSERDPNHVVRENVLPILEEGGVDLVLSGHDHHYERTVPMWQGEASAPGKKGLTYIVAGAGGAGLRDVFPQWWTDGIENKKFSFVSLTINKCELTGSAIAMDGTTVDTFALNGCE
ncbi:MAG: putative MPP superfamily phosphohydrolase [Myxococcota bacterium]|jgi:predicted MPP superfamily phosphohydrolase